MDTDLPSSIARDSELPDVSGYLERSDLLAGTNVTLTHGSGNEVTIAASGTGGTADGVVDGGSVSGEDLTLTRTNSLSDVTITGLPDVDGVFDAVSFSNVTRDLVFGHYGSGTSTIPLDYLDATQDGRPNAVTSVTVEQGDEVILDSGVYKYIGSVVDTFTTSSIATDDDWVQIDASGGGLTIEDSGTEEGTGITTINFGANLGVTVTGTTADIAGQAGGERRSVQREQRRHPGR